MNVGRIAACCMLAWTAEAAAQAKGKDKGPQALPAGVKVLRDVPYVEGGHERQKLDLYLPQGSGPFPVVVWIHGGAWIGGDKRNPPPLPLAGKGFAVASIHYRFSQHAVFPAQLEDCQAALRWLRQHAAEHRLDPARIALAGGSAGGHLAALTALVGAKTKGTKDDVSVAGAINWFGPSDFISIAAQSPPDTVFQHHAPDSPGSKLLGGPVMDKQALAKQASPVTFVAKDSPPLLILHGKQDKVVPWQQSQQLHDALKQAGADSTLVLVEDGGHGPKLMDPPQLRQAEAFLRRVLKVPMP